MKYVLPDGAWYIVNQIMFQAFDFFFQIMQQKCEYGTKQASMFCACDDPNFLCKVVTSIHLPFWLATVFENGDWCFLPLPPGTMSVAGLMTHQVSMIRTIISSHYLPQAGCGKYTGLGYGVVSFPHNKMWRTKWPWGWDMGVFGISKSGKHSTFVIYVLYAILCYINHVKTETHCICNMLTCPQPARQKGIDMISAIYLFTHPSIHQSFRDILGME